MNNPQSKLLLPLCYLISAFSAFADTETIAGIEWYYTISSEKATIGSGVWQGRGAIETSCTGTVSIPDVLGGCPVTYINHFAFDGCSGLTAITIPDSVTSIGDFAFRDCPGLTSITIPDSVTSIGFEAFYNCDGLTSITIPDGVTSIGNDAFFKCTGLEEVHIADLAAWCGISFASGLANPCYHAHRLFLNGEEVKALVVPDGVTSIGAYAFDGCSGLKSITIPDSVTSVGDSAFRDCPGLTSITIPDGVTSIGNGAFSGCSGLTSITIPDSVTSIGESAFEGCSGLTSLTIPDSVTTIGQHTFYGCSGLTSITIPDSVASIGHSAFRDCSGLTSVAIPNRVTSIDGFAFSGCSGLKEVVIPGRFQLSAVFPESYNRITNAIVALGSEIITSSAFAGCSGLIAITIPDSVTRIGDSAFSGCSKLEAVNISDVDAWCRILFTSSLSNPLGYAHHLFLDDCEVTSVTTPDGLDYVHNYFLYGGSSLTSVTIPDGVTSIGNGAFSGCSGLTSITIPDSVTSIGESAFEGCSGLTSLTIPDSVTSIGENTFFDCSGLSSITIPDGVTSLECGAFCGCSGLTSIVIPESVTSIKDYAFFGCSGLTTITIPDGVTRIENETFSACLGLTSVTIPDSVMFIWSSAFQDCCNIRNVAMPGSFRMSSTFPNSYSAITNLVLTSGTTQLAEQLVVGCSELFSIVVPEDNTTYASRDGILFSKDGETLFAYPCGRTNSYAIPADVRVIGASAFEGCSRMEWVDIPDGVLSIGSRAFYGCSGLTSITIPESVTSIGDNTFSGCSDMEWIRIPRCFENRITALSLPASCLILYYDCVASLAISSRYGHPKESGDGSPYVNWDFAMSCDVESIVADENTSDIRYVCIGWKGTGSVPATGTGTNCTFVLTEDSTLEWLWQTNVWISLAVDGEATSTFKHGWFADDAPASVPFNAPAGLLKCVVSGDADGVTIDQAARTISIPTDRPRAVVLHIESYCESVSTNGKFVDYTLSGDAPWEPVSEASGADGRCLRSGLIASGETSVLETKVSGSGMLTFRWKTSCNRGDYCKLIVDGVEIESISRSASAWATVEHEIEGAGEHTVRWSWEKSASAALGENGAFLDDVCWKPYVTFAVASTDGTPNPATGTKRYLYGDAIDASVSEPAAANGTRRVCTGWTGTGSVPAAGAGMAVSFAITNDSTLVWNWRSEYWIDIKTRGAATTDFQAQWVPEGTTAIAEIVPSSPVAAMALLGDAQGATLDGTTLSVVANGPRTITVRATLPNISLDVASTHGTSFPAPGRNWFAWGAEVAASVSEPSPSNGVQYVCTGWIGTGDVPAHGTGTNATFVVKQASALDWTWQTNVWLSLVCEGLVAADLGGEWVEKGATRTVRYEPLAEFFTVALGGDTDGVSLNEVDRTITIPADRPRDLSLALTMHTLRSALDAEGFVWMTSNAFPWVPQAAFSSDGEDAAQSGGIATGEESILMTTLHGPGTLSWSWFLAAEGVLGVDVELDGEYMTSLETSGAWMTDSLAIEGDDDHTIRFVFWNEDPDATSRTEYAYLDQFSWTGTAPTPLATKNTPAPVLHTWLAERAPSILAGVGGDCEAAAATKAANGRFVWECFVANINPEDPDADFRATIDWQDGHFRVGVDPDLGDKRVYEFDGKETLDAAWGPTNDLSRFFRAKVSLPPDWTPDGCIDGFPEAVTVTLDPNGGTVDPTFLSFARPGVGLLGELPLPDRIGAFFADWHSASGVPFTAASVLPWIDFTLFAGWDIAVSFNPNGGTGAMPTLMAPLGEPLALPENEFDWVGHSFGGWAVDSTGEASYQPGDEVAFDSSRTLFAAWGVNRYELTFDAAGGSTVPPQTNAYAAAVVAPAAPTRDGYAFEGWDPPLPQTMPASNLLSTALWRLESHTLSFDSSGGSAVAPITQESGTELVAPPPPTRTGYDFAGWSGGMPATMPGSDTTLVAQWTPHRYLVRFRQNGGTGGILDLALAYDETIALPACQFTNGVSPFIGWATIPNGPVIYDDGAEVSNLTAEDDGFVELFAIWSPGTYTIHFDPNGGVGTMPDQTCWIGIRTNLLENVFAKINRFFVGWSTNANDGAVYADRESVIDLAAVGEATTLYAIWSETVPGLAIRYYDVSSSGYNSWSDRESGLIGYFGSDNPTIETNTLVWGDSLDAGFSGSYSGSTDLNRIESIGSSVDSTNRFHGKYAAAEQANIGVYLAGLVSVPEGGTYSFRALADDYFAVFVDGVRICRGQWNSIGSGDIDLSEGFHRISIGFHQGSGGKGFAVQWKRPGGADWEPLSQSVLRHRCDGHAISFDANGGTGEMSSVEADYNFGAALPSCTMTKIGHSFAGWATSETGAAVFADGTGVPPGIFELYAVWKADRYTISFDSAGGSDVNPITQDYDSVIAPPVNPTRACYEFSGWIPAVPSTMPASNTTCVAQWMKTHSILSFDTANGSVVPAITQAIDSVVAPPADLIRTGYTFSGWIPEIPLTMPVTDMVCVAQWTPIEFTARFNANGGTGEMDDFEYNYEMGSSGRGLVVQYYDISSSGYSIWTQSEAAMTDYFASRTPTIVTNSLDWGETLQSGFQEDSVSVYFRNFPGLWLEQVSTNRYHGKYANKSQDYFAMLFEGDLVTSEEGTYQFASSCDDAIVLYVDGVKVCSLSISSWDSQSSTTGAISLLPGLHRITIGTYEGGGSAGMFVEWKKTDETVWSPLPQSVLFQGRGVSIPACEFAKTGHSFGGWATEPNGEIVYADGEPPSNVFTDNVETLKTLYAVWSVNQYTVSFDSAGGSDVDPITQDYATAVTPPADPTREGYSFAGWNPAVPISMPASNLTCRAQWQPDENHYVVRFDANGGAGQMPDQVFALDVSQALSPNVFAKSGMRFAGWSVGEGDEAVIADGQSVANLAGPGESITLRAVWEEIPLYCIIDLSGGANATSYPVSYLSEPPAGGFNTDEYKTTKLVLKRLDPGPVPKRNAALTKPFYVGLFEVTQKQWELVTGSNPSSFSGNTRPVECVSYNDIRGSSLGSQWPASNAVDAGSFLGKLRARTGQDFDLPTEAQWEYACRAGTTTTYGYGDSANGDYMWYGDNSSGQTHAVGEKLPNAWGLYDMHGNVWEWCLDWYGSSLSGNDPVGSSSGSARVIRGGSWGDYADYCTSSRRVNDYPSDSCNDLGFRLVRPLSNE